jgi:hypothetical protein
LKKILSNIIYFIIYIIESIELFHYDLDEDDITKKILFSSKFNKKLLSDSGFVNTSNIHITQPYRIWELELENGLYLECADNHILFRHGYSEVRCKDLNIGDYILTINGEQKISKLKKTNKKVCMFDVTVDHPSHRYYTNDILSHNTINAAIVMLHYVTFNNDKNIMIVANIAATTVEIVDKIKSIYTLLPFFLKIGIKNWNQKTIIFENGCRIKSSARSKTPAIGFTIDFLYIDEFAHIPANIIENYYTAVYPVVSALENSKIIITSTPNGMNKFYQILNDAERPDGDPLKNSYRSLRVYWYQVPGRFVTYCRLNPFRLKEFGVDKEFVYNQLNERFSSRTKTMMRFDSELTKDVIHIFNNEDVSDDEVKSFILNIDGQEVSIRSISEVTTWKEESIKNIGGEDAFNQEFGLRFINDSKSLLNETIVEKMLQNKKNFIWERIDELDRRLKFSYEDLKWIDDDSIYQPIVRKQIRGVISVDIAEGLGQDYSVINIFKISLKSADVIERTRHKYTHLSDFFCLEQIGMFRSNWVSVKQLTEIFYVLQFEYFNDENFKVVLELNNYGNEFLAHLPHLFEGNNNYGSGVFLKYKHRADATEEKIGLKVGENKNLLVKSYQECMDIGNFLIYNDQNIKEITTFVKRETTSGNIKYCADIGNDDTVMTLVNASSVFQKHSFREMVEDYARTLDPSIISSFNTWLNQNEDLIQATDYSSLINANRERRFNQQYKEMSLGRRFF